MDVKPADPTPPSRDQLTPFVRQLDRPARPSVVPKTRIDVRRAGSLSALQQDWALFTPAVLYLRGWWPDWRWHDVLPATGVEPRLAYLRTDWPLFRGLDDSSGGTGWNSALFAVRLEDWSAVSDFVVQSAAVDPETGSAVTYAEQPVVIADVPILDRGGVIDRVPTLSVMAFGVRRSDATWAFLKRPPTLTQFPPDPRIAALARAVRAAENPLVAVARLDLADRLAAVERSVRENSARSDGRR